MEILWFKRIKKLLFQRNATTDSLPKRETITSWLTSLDLKLFMEKMQIHGDHLDDPLSLTCSINFLDAKRFQRLFLQKTFR